MGTVKKKSERGQSLVEFTLLLPLLMFLLLGLLDVGRLYYAYVAVTDAASEGANYGARNPGDMTQIKLRASEALDGLVQVGTDDVTITSSSDLITVTVTYDHKLVTPFVNAIVPGGVLPLRAVAVHTK
jgi:hypothetical protein